MTVRDRRRPPDETAAFSARIDAARQASDATAETASMLEQEVQSARSRAVLACLRQICCMALEPSRSGLMLHAVDVEHENARRRPGGHADERAGIVAPKL